MELMHAIGVLPSFQGLRAQLDARQVAHTIMGSRTSVLFVRAFDEVGRVENPPS
jgi:hypothetical protein